MRARIAVVSVLLMVFLTAVVTADDVAPLGRDVARDGNLLDITGTLQYEDNEWYLNTGADVYEMHMGVLGHEDGLPFSEGATAQVHGFVMPDHIAPIRVVSADQTVEFWSADRYPLWSGSGDRRNAVDPASGARAATADDTTRGLGAGRQNDDTFERGFRNQDDRPGQGQTL